MKNKDFDDNKISQLVRDLIIESSEDELQDDLKNLENDFNDLVKRGISAANKAMKNIQEESAQVEDLHRGLGALIQMLRKRDNISIDFLAEKAQIDVYELKNIEENVSFQPTPRTIYQLAQYFQLPPKSLVILSGAIRVKSSIQIEALRFAASSNNISSLTSEEKELLNRFVKFLSKHTDE